MVTFKLIEETEPMLVYYYFPEGRENKKPGIIVIDRITGEIKISELAEDDSERDILPEELNEMAKRINQMEQEHGGDGFCGNGYRTGSLYVLWRSCSSQNSG